MNICRPLVLEASGIASASFSSFVLRLRLIFFRPSSPSSSSSSSCFTFFLRWAFSGVGSPSTASSSSSATLRLIFFGDVPLPSTFASSISVFRFLFAFLALSPSACSSTSSSFIVCLRTIFFGDVWTSPCPSSGTSSFSSSRLIFFRCLDFWGLPLSAVPCSSSLTTRASVFGRLRELAGVVCSLAPSLSWERLWGVRVSSADVNRLGVSTEGFVFVFRR